MTMQELVRLNRSYRRFDQTHTLDAATLCALVDLGRLSPCGGNVQSLRYAVVCGAKLDDVFQTLGWAAYLKEWPGPIDGERPTGYIVMIGDTALAKNPMEDAGIAAQSIMLGAVERGLGGCIFKNINRAKLKDVLGLADGLDILMVLAIGRPVETVVLDDLAPGGDVKYWRDEAAVHHVPKRRLEDVLIDAES